MNFLKNKYIKNLAHSILILLPLLLGEFYGINWLATISIIIYWIISIFMILLLFEPIEILADSPKTKEGLDQMLHLKYYTIMNTVYDTAICILLWFLGYHITAILYFVHIIAYLLIRNSYRGYIRKKEV